MIFCLSPVRNTAVFFSPNGWIRDTAKWKAHGSIQRLAALHALYTTRATSSENRACHATGLVSRSNQDRPALPICAR
jgi:hypothetical protein